MQLVDLRNIYGSQRPVSTNQASFYRLLPPLQSFTFYFPPMISHALLIFSILVSSACSGDGATAAYDPTEVFLFNCGATADDQDNGGRTWTMEQQKHLKSSSSNASFPSKASKQDSSISKVPYMTARIFQSASTYSFPVSPGWKFVRLYFYPTRYESDLDAVSFFFSVTVNAFTLLRNFSADLTAKGSTPPSEFVIKEFIVPVSSGVPTLNLTFTPSPKSFAFVNGVEIVSMPDGFYTKGGFNDDILPVGSSVGQDINNATALETVYRLNVAGQPITNVNDSGMFRRWLADYDFLWNKNSGQSPPPDGNSKINYTEKTPAYVAPEDVYLTFRSMGNAEHPRLNLEFNLTWLFPVDAGFNYLVRLHFCETMQEVINPGQRMFSIFIGNQIAKPETDVISLSGGSRIPVYLDFLTSVDSNTNGAEERPDLRLDLHPFEEVKPRFYDAILNGVEILKLNDFEGNLAGPNPNPPPPSPVAEPGKPVTVKPKSHILATILAVVGSVVGLATVVVIVVVLMRRKKTKDYSLQATSKATDHWGYIPHNKSTTTTTSASSLPSDLCRRFSIGEIRSATDDFDEKLIIGVGGFGSVYKGRIDGGVTRVAIKRLGTASNQGAQEFETELEMLSKLRHVHLVSLIGYCDDGKEMVLVYEYMPRGTLRDHLYKRDTANDPPLPWKRRLEICIGAARGLQYLHTGAKYTIIHRDVKTTNILLDENFVAKVSDFGLSKEGPTTDSQTHVSTTVKGTFGYLDPEYYRRQHLTEKSDVYSFGVVLFEVLCCRSVRINNVPPEQADLIRWVKSNHLKGTVDQIVDPDLTHDITPTSLDKYCEIALRCIHDRGTERPPMNDVVWALEFALQLHETANKNNDVDRQDALPRGDAGTMTDDDDDLLSRTTRDTSRSMTTNERSGSSSEAVFSEIKEPKAR